MPEGHTRHAEASILMQVAGRYQLADPFGGQTGVGTPKRLRLFSAAGRLVRGGRRLRLRLAATWPWAGQLTAAITRLQAYAPG
jgi:hypothetical protein